MHICRLISALIDIKMEWTLTFNWFLLSPISVLRPCVAAKPILEKKYYISKVYRRILG